ncbi:hypothetical protein DYB32_005663 [Aphanomyces invadans]|uniref:Protein kinase domain-containing protein n=1 Tax=Aphanomyces invadans TaxID=157072 RepID=A0A3R6VKN0_9STRA|nr:hypothetical protein DYB32_005663 [Aphanomyces invadans]
MGCVSSRAKSTDEYATAVDRTERTSGTALKFPNAIPLGSTDGCYDLESSHVEPTINTASTDNDTSHSSLSSSTLTADLPVPSPTKPLSTTAAFATWINNLNEDPLLATVAIPYDCLLLQSSSRPTGIFGNVHRGTYQAMAVVVHRLDASKINERRLRIFKDDIYLLMRLQHPNIVQIADTASTPSQESSSGSRWMAPERILGEPYDGKADVYSFGICTT